jgi:phage gp46-like protein
VTLRIVYSQAIGGFDFAVGTGRLAIDDGLETDVALSLFTDARATTDELRAAGMPLDDHRGCWIDGVIEGDADVVGSKLWLLSRALRNDDTLAEAQTEAQRALSWLVEYGIASQVSVSARWWGTTGFLALDVSVTQPSTTEPRWRRVWAATGELLE